MIGYSVKKEEFCNQKILTFDFFVRKKVNLTLKNFGCHALNSQNGHYNMKEHSTDDQSTMIPMTENDFLMFDFSGELPPWISSFGEYFPKIIKSYSEFNLTFMLDLFGNLVIKPLDSETSTLYELNFSPDELISSAEVSGDGRFLLMVFTGGRYQLAEFPKVKVVRKGAGLKSIDKVKGSESGYLAVVEGKVLTRISVVRSFLSRDLKFDEMIKMEGDIWDFAELEDRLVVCSAEGVALYSAGTQGKPALLDRLDWNGGAGPATCVAMSGNLIGVFRGAALRVLRVGSGLWEAQRVVLGGLVQTAVSFDGWTHAALLDDGWLQLVQVDGWSGRASVFRPQPLPRPLQSSTNRRGLDFSGSMCVDRASDRLWLGCKPPIIALVATWQSVLEGMVEDFDYFRAFSFLEQLRCGRIAAFFGLTAKRSHRRRLLQAALRRLVAAFLEENLRLLGPVASDWPDIFFRCAEAARRAGDCETLWTDLLRFARENTGLPPALAGVRRLLVAGRMELRGQPLFDALRRCFDAAGDKEVGLSGAGSAGLCSIR